MKRVIAFLILIVLIGGGYFLYQRREARLKGVNTYYTIDLRPQNFYTVRRGALMKTISATGFIKPVKEKDLRFSTSGTIKEVNVAKGQRVKEGQLLAVVENSSQELALLKARHNNEQAQISSNAAVKEERALEYQIAEKNYKNTFLYSPFAGLITSVEVEEGDQVNSSTPVVHLIDDSSFLIDLQIHEVDSNQLKEGQRVIITVDALPGLTFEGKIIDVGLVAVNQGGIVTIPVQVMMGNTDPQLKSGMSASTEIVIGEVKNALLIPITAIIYREDGAYVMKK